MKMNRRDDVGGSAGVWLIPLVFGATVACVTMVPILVRERTDLPLNVIGFFAMPGVFLSLVLTGSAHDPKLLLATVLNAVLYAGLFAWVRAYRKRKRQRPTAA